MNGSLEGQWSLSGQFFLCLPFELRYNFLKIRIRSFIPKNRTIYQLHLSYSSSKCAHYRAFSQYTAYLREQKIILSCDGLKNCFINFNHPVFSRQITPFLVTQIDSLEVDRQITLIPLPPPLPEKSLAPRHFTATHKILGFLYDQSSLWRQRAI